MQELQMIDEQFISTKEQLSVGKLITIHPSVRAERMTVHHVWRDQANQEVWLSVYHYDEQGNYKVIYLTLNADGELIHARQEKEGVLPAFFAAPDQSVWVSLTSVTMNGTKEIVLPIEQRSRINKASTAREFPIDADLSGNGEVLFYNYDVFHETKPPRLCYFLFDSNHIYTKRKMYKIPVHSTEYVLRNEHGIHLLYEKESQYLHSCIDTQTGNMTTRQLLMECAPSYPLTANLDAESVFLHHDGGHMYTLQVNQEGKCINKKLLFALEEEEYFYSLFRPQSINDNTVIVRFTYGKGNGWFVIKDNDLAEAYIYQPDIGAYVEYESKHQIQVPFEEPIIHAVTGFADHSYGIVWYSLLDRTAAWIFIRSI